MFYLTLKPYFFPGNKTKPTDSNDIIHVSDTKETSGAVCARVQCAYEATCAVDGNGQPRCACLFDCAAASVSSAPVCASDLRLYPNLCHMKLEACRRQEDLRLRPLALCRGLEVNELVANQFYHVIHKKKLFQTFSLHPIFFITLFYKNKRPRILIYLLNYPTSSPNQLKFYIVMYQFRPCGDDEALTDAEGRMMDCGGGPHRKDCPAGSYCHHTAKAARCCKKGIFQI